MVMALGVPLLRPGRGFRRLHGSAPDRSAPGVGASRFPRAVIVGKIKRVKIAARGYFNALFYNRLAHTPRASVKSCNDKARKD